MKNHNRVIVVEDCLQCPLITNCKAFNALTPKQKFMVKTAVGIKDFILKGCPLKSVEELQNTKIED